MNSKQTTFTERLLLALLLMLSMIVTTGCGESEAPAIGEEAHAGEEHEEEGHQEGIVELPPEKLAELTITTRTAEQKLLTSSLTTTGQVGYDENLIAHVSPRIPGRIDRVRANLGDHVRAGESLAIIDSVEMGRATADYLAASAQETLTRKNYERERALHEDRISSEKEMLEAQNEFQRAQTERQRTEETLRLYGLDREEIGSLARGDRRGPLMAVRSPIAGVVAGKHVTTGEVVDPQDKLFTIADLRQVWIWIDVHERDLGRVHQGDPVAVKVDAFPGETFSGEVSYIPPAMDPDSRTARARIEVQNDGGVLRPGMFARINVREAHGTARTAAIVVPSSAVQRQGPRNLVFIPLGNGRFEARAVSTGRQEDDLIEIVSGLESGEEVVTEGGFFLKSELASEELGGGHGH